MQSSHMSQPLYSEQLKGSILSNATAETCFFLLFYCLIVMTHLPSTRDTASYRNSASGWKFQCAKKYLLPRHTKLLQLT